MQQVCDTYIGEFVVVEVKVFQLLDQLTDIKGLEKLTQLRFLGLQNNPALTEAQIDELQKALPKCKIISDFE